MDQGDAETALSIYKDILQKEPDNADAQLSLAIYYSKQENDSLYFGMLNKVVLNPKLDNSARITVMQNLFAKNEADSDSIKNVQLLNNILSINEDDADMAKVCASYLHERHFDLETIRPTYERILTIAPDEAQCRVELLQEAIRKEDTLGIIKLCRPALDYNPEYPVFAFYLGIAYFQNSQNQEAIKALRRGADNITQQSDAEIATDIYALLGDIYHEEGQKEEAYAAYDSALVYKEDNVGALNNYAYYLSLENRELERAEEMSYKTIKQEPTNWTYLDTYAWILFKEKRFSEARIYIDEAIKNEGNERPDIVEHAGDIYFHTGDKAKAVELWKEALDLGSESKNIKTKIKLKKYIE